MTPFLKTLHTVCLVFITVLFVGLVTFLFPPRGLWAAVTYPPGALLQPGDVTSSHIRDGAIVNADVSSTAAIAISKIATTTDNFFVTSSTQTFVGLKTFTTIPSIPTSTPSTGDQVASKTYVDSASVIVWAGDGSDGDVTISATTTLSRDMFYDDLTVSATLNTGGFKIYAKSSIAGAGTITNASTTGGNGGAGASGAAGGAGGAAGAAGTAAGCGYLRTCVAGLAGVAGANAPASGAGVNGTNGLASATTTNGYASSTGPLRSGQGGNGGCNGSCSSAGGTGGASSTPGTYSTSTYPKSFIGFHEASSLFDVASSTLITTGGQHGGAGSGGSGASNNPERGGGGGGSGGSGGNGGLCWIAAKTFTFTGTINCSGGAGGNGGNGGDGNTSSGGGGGGGGGNGGNGGIIILITGSQTKTWTTNVAGGAGGTGGSGGAAGGGGSGVGTAGTNGNAGGQGLDIWIR